MSRAAKKRAPASMKTAVFLAMLKAGLELGRRVGWDIRPPNNRLDNEALENWRVSHSGPKVKGFLIGCGAARAWKRAADGAQLPCCSSSVAEPRHALLLQFAPVAGRLGHRRAKRRRLDRHTHRYAPRRLKAHDGRARGAHTSGRRRSRLPLALRRIGLRLGRPRRPSL